MYLIQKNKQGFIEAVEVEVIANFQTTFVYLQDNTVKSYSHWKMNEVIQTSDEHLEFKASTEDINRIEELSDKVYMAYAEAYQSLIESATYKLSTMKQYKVNKNRDVVICNVGKILANPNISGTEKYINSGGDGILRFANEAIDSQKEIVSIIDYYIKHYYKK